MLWKNSHFTCATGQVTVLRTQLVQHEFETTFGNKTFLVTTLGGFQIQENDLHHPSEGQIWCSKVLSVHCARSYLPYPQALEG